MDETGEVAGEGEEEEEGGVGIPAGLEHTPELEAAADRVLASGGDEIVVGNNGRRMVFVSDTLLEGLKKQLGAEPVEAEMAQAWKIKRDDGRMVYVWGYDRGTFGMGKPKV